MVYSVRTASAISVGDGSTGPGGSSAASAPLVGISATSPAAAGVAWVTSEMKSGTLSVFDSELSKLYLQSTPVQGPTGMSTASFAAGVQAFSNATTLLPNSVVTVGKTTYVNIDVVAKNGDGASLLPALEKAGLQNADASQGLVSGTIAVSKLGALHDVLTGPTASTSDDIGLARASGMMLNAGSVTTQADTAEYANLARTNYGVDGTGVTVGVLSDSFNTSGHGSYAADIASGDLPAGIRIRYDPTGGTTDEGRAMAQLVHDLAPGAAIEFNSAYNNQAAFAQHILALANDGAKVITDDVIYYAELSYQEGPIAQAVDTAANLGVSYFSSAGNNANGSQATGYEHAWVNGASYGGGGETTTLMNFAPGQDYIPVTLAANEVFVLQWANPGASAGGAGATADLDLFLTDQTGATVYLNAISNNIGGDPVEVLGVSGGAGGTYYLRVGLHSGPAPSEIRLMALANGQNVSFTSPAGNLNKGTFYGHAAATGAMAIGAASYASTPAFGVSPPVLENYSSRLTDKFLYDEDGKLLTTPYSHSVAFTAVDGGNTSFFGSDDGDADSSPNFYGTSAAAPDAAAVAALMLSANGALTPADIKNLITDSATDMGAAGPDTTNGAGLLNAQLAVGYAKTGTISNATQQTVNGTHLADTIIGTSANTTLMGLDGNDTLQGTVADETLNGGTGSDTASYANAATSVTVDLTVVGSQNTGGGGHDTLVSIENLIGSPQGDTLTGGATSNTLTGGVGDDTLSGGGGNDFLIGGPGQDSLTSGTGNDRFVFQAVGDSTVAAPDTINDFVQGQDQIDLRLIDANTATPADEAFHFRTTPSSTHFQDLLFHYDAVHNRTVVDLYVNNDATPDSEIWIAGNVNLQSTDFIL